MTDLKQFDETKREEYEIERLMNIKFTDLEGKYAAQEEIQKVRAGLMQELTDNNSSEERQIIHNILYDLKTAKHNTEVNMRKIAGFRG